MKKASISIVLSITAIIICIINFFVFNIRVAPYEFDVYGVLVGILGILVTFLLGWQIFSVFQMKKEIDKLKADISQEVDTEIEKLREDVKEHTNQMDDELRNLVSGLGFEFYGTILTDHYLKNSGSFSFFSKFKNLIMFLLYANNVSSPLYEEKVEPVVKLYLRKLIKLCRKHKSKIRNLDPLIKKELLEKIDIFTEENKKIDFSFLIATLNGTI
ncbi:hypothetical protein [Capnocytophaga gingivalis]|uniref:hypothetical protein n=1 Tax=Capnocytophaga gingivalis TaxID=1017 RepID=UPI0002F77DD7|nr:hypothetical protein [Capnocytophaga gingivalis]